MHCSSGIAYFCSPEVSAVDAGSRSAAFTPASSSNNGPTGTSSKLIQSTPLTAAIKRASPDYFVNSDSSPQSPKRQRKDTTNKENIGSSGVVVHGAGRGIEKQPSTEYTDSDGEIWTASRSSSDRNPFAQLTGETHSVNYKGKGRQTSEHSDLAEVSFFPSSEM